MHVLRFFSFALIFAAAVAGCSSQSNNSAGRPVSPLVGKPAPTVELKDLDGKFFALANQKGKPVFLDFWATWCPPCRISIPEVKRLHEDYNPKGVQVISISLDDSPEYVREYVQAAGMSNRQLFAGTSGVDRAFGIRGIPMFVAIDKQGHISKIWTGFSPTMSSEWRAELDRLLAI